MEKITKEYEVYNFEELNQEAQEKVLDKLRQSYLEDSWWESELECISEDLMEKHGINVSPGEIYFSLYEDQLYFGKGARVSNVTKFIRSITDKKVLLAQAIAYPNWRIDDIDLDLVTTTRGDNLIEVRCNGHNYEDGDDRWEECGDILEQELGINFGEEIDKIQKEALKKLQETQDYISSEEYLKAEIKKREMKFLEDGSIFYY